MITIKYIPAEFKVIIQGHAMSDDPGRDLVCAGASALAYTIAANVSMAQNAEMVKDVVIRLNPGDAEISCKPRKKHREIMDTVYNTVCVGFALMARDNPNYISYEICMGEG